MSKYLIEFTRKKASIVVEFNDLGNITQLKVDYADISQIGIVHIVQHIPSKLEYLDHYRSLENVKVTEIPFDTSFENFWDTYGVKAGNKQRSLRLWNALPEEQRIKAIKHIIVYDQFLLQNEGRQKKLPETYLNQQPWNN